MQQNVKRYWNQRVLTMICLDVLILNVVSIISLWTRFDFSFQMIEREFLEAYYVIAPIYSIVAIVILERCKLYRSVWEFASVRELIHIILAVTIISVCAYGLVTALGLYMPRSYYFINYVVLGVGITLLRFSIRAFRMSYQMIRLKVKKVVKKNTMIIGSGKAADAIIRESRISKEVADVICCAIDDNEEKVGKFIAGVPIVGTRESILEQVERYQIQKIIIAIPTIKPVEQKEMLEICKKTHCEVRLLPGMYQLVNGEVSVSRLRKIEIEDLLGREPIRANNDEIHSFIKGKVVLVTGGGGSIGSEICRQVAKQKPKQLIIFDICENGAYAIQQELKRTHTKLKLEVLIGSVQNTNRIQEVMKEYRPNVVYHAAAHKHVPLMEDSPNEAIKNNVFGTYNTAEAAGKYGVQNFVLISSDKAVNPTNIMGASKRICEMIIQNSNKRYGTNFVAVRFGNVLGSSGSVVPLFKQQILQGGPVTVTHPDIIRYFMTIAEATSLVLQAGAYAKGGEIFVLDMGEPVKIVDLARNLIHLSGYEPDVDIAIEYVGLRPGEKLYEELLMDEEGLKRTENKLIFVGAPIPLELDFETQLHQLKYVAYQETGEIREYVARIVKTYHWNGEEESMKEKEIG